MDLLKPDFGLLVWNLIAFLAAFFILKKFAWPAIIKGLRDRETNISESLATAEKVKAEMAQLKSENEELLVQAREERAAMIREAREMRDKILNEAKEEARIEKSRLTAEAQDSINNMKMAALTDIKNQIGTLVLEVSERVLRRELGTKSEQENYIRQLSEEIKLN